MIRSWSGFSEYHAACCTLILLQDRQLASHVLMNEGDGSRADPVTCSHVICQVTDYVIGHVVDGSFAVSRDKVR